MPKHEMDYYFRTFRRDIAVFKSLQDGYTQNEIGKYLYISTQSVADIVSVYKQKVKLFNKLRDKGVFWSYDRKIQYYNMNDAVFIEYILKYGDFADLKSSMELFGRSKIKKIWEDRLKSDRQFIKTNLMIARVFFDMDIESDYFKDIKNARFEKLKLLASQN